MSGGSTWIQEAQFWVTLLLGAGAAGIAFMQWWNARQKLILDLFDKRFAVYRKMMDSMLNSLARDIGKSHQKMNEAAIECDFLFSSAVVDQLQRTGKTINNINEITAKYGFEINENDAAELPDTDIARSYLRERMEIQKNVWKELGELHILMTPFLAMRQRLPLGSILNKPLDRGWGRSKPDERI